jgi:hypothetical protein
MRRVMETLQGYLENTYIVIRMDHQTSKLVWSSDFLLSNQ